VVFRPVPAPCILRSRVHPLVSSVLLQSTVLQSPARARLRLERLPWGLVPHRDISTRSPLFGERPASAFVPPSAFRTPSTVCSSPHLAHLFHRATASRVPAPGVSSHVPAAPPHRRPLPSRRWRRRLPVARRQRTSRRPQGLAPDRGPQCPAGFLRPHGTRVPSCVFSFLRLRPVDLGSAVTLPPLATFTTWCCVSTASLALSVSIDPRAVASVPRGPSCPSFLDLRAGCPCSRGPSVSSDSLRPPTPDPMSRRRARLRRRPSMRIQRPDCFRECRCQRQGCGQLVSGLCRTSSDRRATARLRAHRRRGRHVCRERAITRPW
jgi:hypothetical protein